MNGNGYGKGLKSLPVLLDFYSRTKYNVIYHCMTRREMRFGPDYRISAGPPEIILSTGK